MSRLDSWGYGRLMLLVEASESDDGMSDEDRDCVFYPLRRPQGMRKAPKMGELKADGSRVKKKFAFPYRVHRLYFGLPAGEARLVIGVGAGTKVTNDQGGYRKQRQKIAKAMGHMGWFFGERGYQWEDL